MQLEKKALYNLLRLEKEQHSVPHWKVDNYRQMDLSTLFKELEKLQIILNTQTFLAYSEQIETPDELAECLSLDHHDLEREDHVFLLIFELWRRLVPEKRCLSIFCDELDEQILNYDQGKREEENRLHDILSNLQTILEENVDAGQDPILLFETVQSHSIHDLESFLYDFIAEKIDEESIIAANDYLEDFYPFIKDKAWFNFLKARLYSSAEHKICNEIIKELIEEEPPDTELYLEMLQFLSHYGNPLLFVDLAKKTLPLLESEDQFQDLLFSVAAYYCSRDQEKNEALVQDLIKNRKDRDLNSEIDPADQDVKSLQTILKG